nr:MAG TPA: hypothetical protein [Caudoviricetes sp.]
MGARTQQRVRDSLALTHFSVSSTGSYKNMANEGV